MRERDPMQPWATHFVRRDSVIDWIACMLVLWTVALIGAVHFIDVKTQRVATGPAGFEAITAPCEKQP